MAFIYIFCIIIFLNDYFQCKSLRVKTESEHTTVNKTAIFSLPQPKVKHYNKSVK